MEAMQSRTAPATGALWWARCVEGAAWSDTRTWNNKERIQARFPATYCAPHVCAVKFGCQVGLVVALGFSRLSHPHRALRSGSWLLSCNEVSKAQRQEVRC